jgi:hypothetical protein
MQDLGDQLGVAQERRPFLSALDRAQASGSPWLQRPLELQPQLRPPAAVLRRFSIGSFSDFGYREVSQHDEGGRIGRVPPISYVQG